MGVDRAGGGPPDRVPALGLHVAQRAVEMLEAVRVAHEVAVQRDAHHQRATLPPQSAHHPAVILLMLDHGLGLVGSK